MPWTGVFPAIPTVFDATGGLQIEATADLSAKLVHAGVDGIVALGTIGECCSLSADEKRAVLTALVERAAGRFPVLSGVAEFTTREAARFAADAEAIGVNGLMVLPAMAYSADAREVETHFREVAAATKLELMAYNNPVSYGVDIRPEAFASLSDIPHLVAIKESSDDPRRVTDIFNACGDRYDVFCGVDDLVFESVALGAVGWVSGLVNAFPAESVQLWRLLMDGRFADARCIYRWFTPLLHLDTDKKLVQMIKLVAAECGYGTEYVRAPRLALEGAERHRVQSLLAQAKETHAQIFEAVEGATV